MESINTTALERGPQNDNGSSLPPHYMIHAAASRGKLMKGALAISAPGAQFDH